MVREISAVGDRAVPEERRQGLTSDVRLDRMERWLTFLEKRVWPTIPEDQLGLRLTKEEEEALLGYGPGGT